MNSATVQPGHNPAPCRYFLEGRCRFGDRCRNLHLPVESVTDSNFGNEGGIGAGLIGLFDHFAGFHEEGGDVSQSSESTFEGFSVSSDSGDFLFGGDSMSVGEDRDHDGSTLSDLTHTLDPTQRGEFLDPTWVEHVSPRQYPLQPNNAPTNPAGQVTSDEVRSFMTRVAQSVDSQAAKIAELEAENERLRELAESDGGTERMSLLKCGICLDLKKAPQFFINTPCGHCFCQTCTEQLSQTVQRSNCPTCRKDIERRTRLYI